MASILLGALLTIGSACDGGRSAGSVCEEHSDCEDSLQCLASVCVSRCTENTHCGDGYECSSSGSCDQVLSELGDSCTSEWQCGLNQSCQLNDLADSDGRLGGICLPQGQGFNVGAECSEDQDCRSDLCAIGRCSLLCTVSGDCPNGTACTDLPRTTLQDSAIFRGCLQNFGVLKHTIQTSGPKERLMIPVPASARSFAMVSTADDDIHTIGAVRVESPTGILLHDGVSTVEERENDAIRYFRNRRVSTLMVPNRDTLELETGFYQVDVEASLGQLGIGTITPEVTVFYKLDDRRNLDLHFYFLDLEDHPCRGNFGGDTLSSAEAPLSSNFQNEYLKSIKRILGGGEIDIGQINYTDIQRADLDGIVDGDLDNLFRLAQNESGIAIFFVRSLSPDGVQAQVGGVPGPPRMPGTAKSGIAISADTLCYRSWQDLARVTSHTIAGQMGLWNNRDPQGVKDPISDSDTMPANLMFFGERGGEELSPGQTRVLGLYPGLR